MFGRSAMPGALVVAIATCAPREKAPQPIDTPSSSSTTGTTGGGASGGTGGAGSGGTGSGAGGAAGTGPGAVDAHVESGAPDAGPDTPLVIIHQDGSAGGAACVNNFAALGSNRLLAGGATPAN